MKREQRAPHQVSIEELEAEGVIPDPFDLELFIKRLEKRRGRPIQMIPISARRGAPCGLYIKAVGTDYLCYVRSSSPLHECHILLHELGHLVLGHQDSGWRSEELQRMLLPDLHPDMIKRVLCRNGYADPAEDAAEAFAELILAPRVLAPGNYTVPAATPPPEIAEVVRNIEQAWGSERGF
ncbi:hypothetical protein ACQP2T_33820 [Nonomuraea sp. CA-143628]|uniref:hypothetical protein n=1 Tax=Nonomuraea sp. CA-143628 TaxID=3239997 RepID=UPI003D947F96